MKKAIKTTTAMMLLAGLMSVCFATTGCSSSKSSSETMYRRNSKNSQVVKRNYKVRGTNKNNSSTYRTY